MSKRWDNNIGDYVDMDEPKKERTFSRKQWHDEENDTYHERIAYPTLNFIQEFEVNNAGYIKNPGKFEGERTYVPYYWQETLDGGCDTEYVGDKPYFVVQIEPKDRFIFGIPEAVQIIVLEESDQGFVSGTAYEDVAEWETALEEARSEVEYEEDEDAEPVQEFELVKGLHENNEKFLAEQAKKNDLPEWRDK